MIEVKIIKKSRQGTAISSCGSSGMGGILSGVIKEAEHAARADIAEFAKRSEMATDAEHAIEADHAKEADHAEMAHDLDPDSPVRDQFLSKIKSDRTPYSLAIGGRATAEAGMQFGLTYIPGLVGGKGGWIGPLGDSELNSLILRSFLEVPELRYNRITATVGNQWQAPGAGIVETYNHGTSLGHMQIGGIRLKLEDGEIGSFQEGDICMGIWHYPKNVDGTDPNDTDNYDSGDGDFRFAGFRTIYFNVTSVSGDRNEFLTIQTRPGYTLEPVPGMHIVAYGSFTNPDRRQSCYRTRTYTRYLRDVDNWIYGEENIAAQFGDLSNLTIDGLTMSGYSAYLNNVYFDGVLRQLENSPLRLTYETYGDKYVGDNDDCMIRLTALKGVEDVTDSVTWSVSASTGAATPSVTPKGTLTLGKSVLAGGEEATVTVTATWRKTPDAAPKTASAIIIIRDNALLKGEPGSSYTPNLLKGTKTWDKDAEWGYGTGMGWGSEPDGEMNGFTVLHGNFEGHGTQAYIELAQQFFPVVKGQTYTLSFWAKGTGNMRSFCYPAVNGFLLAGGTGDRSNIALSDTEQVYQLTADWKRHRVSFRVDGSPVESNTRILFRVLAGNEAWIAGAKLETGVNNNPEWSPNDEDLKGEPGKDGEDAVTYDWETDPCVIRCKSDGTPVDTSVTVRCYRIKGETRSSIISTSGGIVMSTDRVQWRIQTDEGISNWTDYTGPVVLDSRDTHPRLMLRVIPLTVAGTEPEPLSQHTVGNVCDGATGAPGESITGPQGPVVRIRGLFASGYYYDGTEAVYENGMPVYWLDIVWVEDGYGNRHYKRCVKSGDYTTGTGPEPNVQKAGWSDFSQLDNLIVNLLIAKDAKIQFLNGQEIVFGETVDRKDVIWGRVGVPKDDIIMWAGGADTGMATYLLEKNGLARFGKTSDNHIVIDPNKKQITVRDSSQREMITIDGEPHTLESSYGVTDNLDMGKLEGALTSSSATYTVGTIAFGESGGSLKLTLSAWLQVQSVQYKQTGAGGQEIFQYARATSTVRMRLLKNGVEQSAASGSVASASLNSGLYETPDNRTYDLSAEWTGLAAGTYAVQVLVTITRDTETDISGNKVTAKADARLSHAVKAIGVPESYRAFMCGNALVSANSMLDYFRAAKTTSGYMTEMSAGNFGLRVSRSGLIAKDSDGAWNAVLVTCEKQAADANKCVLEQLGSRIFTTDANTVNLPSGAGTLYGAITTTTLNATAGHHIQEWKSFSQPVQCYTRRCMNNAWGAWTRNY